ncbi:MAG: ORF6N domain-containing protein [Nitrospirota bacterium]
MGGNTPIDSLTSNDVTSSRFSASRLQFTIVPDEPPILRRNPTRFPPDFMFQLNKQEKEEVVTNCDHLKKLKFLSNLPHAFTEHRAIMLATGRGGHCNEETNH